MSDLESKPEPQASTNWEAQCAALQRQVSTLFLCLFVCSGTLTVFLWRQSRIAGTQLENAERTFRPAVQFYQKEQEASFRAYQQKLADWAATHPDFARFLAAHNIELQATPAPKK
jgi:hypothetical protein